MKTNTIEALKGNRNFWLAWMEYCMKPTKLERKIHQQKFDAFVARWKKATA